MATKPAKPKLAKKAKSDSSTGIKERLKEPKTPPPYAPTTVERVVGKYVDRRAEEMMDFRKGLNIEGRWKQADEEYIPHELDFGTTRKRFETDQDTGLRSRMVPVGDATQQWRQASSAPTLLSKIQTAVSIIFDNMPEADLVALVKKYQGTTALAYSLWKRNWAVTDAKEKMKVLIFNLFKYGWAAQRTYPRKVVYKKRVLIEKDTEHPENDKYEEKDVVWFDDVDREPLNVYRTWIDEMTKPYDHYSMNECYFEIDYSYDAFKTEFGQYANFECVPRDSAMVREEDQSASTNRQTAGKNGQPDKTKMRKDIVTVGFFESRPKDLYALYIPKHKIVLYQSPMPNDDGYLSVTQTMLIMRGSNIPYGISLWEIIRQNKGLYDKMKNMGMDQLVLSIMKFGFFSGTSTALGDGKIDIVPGQARQITSSSGSAKDAINWMEIPGPGIDFWKGIQEVMNMMDNESGISGILEGQDQPGNQTLGEILHQKESALKRLKVPVENIAWLIDQDAYVTLSWMSQLYSIPMIKQFVDEKELLAYEKEEQVEHSALFGQHELNDEGEATGDLTGPYEAHFLPQLSLHLEKSQNGEMKEGKDSKFFQVGKDIMPNQLKWKGVFKTIPRSIIDSSQELMKASKSEMANMLIPLFQFPPELMAKVASQLVKINEEDPEEWLPDNFLQFLETGKVSNAPPNAPPQGDNTLQSEGGTGAVPPAQTVVPKGQVTPPSSSPIGNGVGKSMGVFNRRL